MSRVVHFELYADEPKRTENNVFGVMETDASAQ